MNNADSLEWSDKQKKLLTDLVKHGLSNINIPSSSEIIFTLAICLFYHYILKRSDIINSSKIK